MAKLMRKINVISRCASMYRAQNSGDNLPGIYHSYIFVIYNNPGLSQDKLAKRLCINKSNVTRHMSFLESNGYITRCTSDKDKRELLVYPTEKLNNVYPEIKKISREWNELVSCDISEEELLMFESILDKLSARAMELVYPAEDEQ
ncbi:MAG: MarR family transcriptional regulator [Clostridia bacterium]|nr:MarR family transcriptional regulator [Clostridia bacterium]